MNRRFASLFLRAVCQDGGEADAVLGLACGKFHFQDVGGGREEIGVTDRHVACRASFRDTRPADDKRHPVPALPRVAFHAPPRTGRSVSEFLFVRVVPHRTVVGCEDDDRVFGETGSRQRFCDFSERPVDFHHHVGV